MSKHSDCPNCQCADGNVPSVPIPWARRVRTAADAYRMTVGWMLGCTAVIVTTILSSHPCGL